MRNCVQKIYKGFSDEEISARISRMIYPQTTDWHGEVEVVFEGHARGTRVTVRHTGWDAFAEGHPVRHGHSGEAFTNMMSTWWGDLLVAVGAHVG